MQVALQAATAAVGARREEDPPAKSHSRRSIPDKQYRPMLSQPAFNWEAPDKYVQLLHFEMEVANVLQAKVYDLNEEKKVPTIKNWLGREGM